MQSFVLLLLYTATVSIQCAELVTDAGSSSAKQPCSFPQRCHCSVHYPGTFLRCLAMENCLNQAGMDAIASSIKPDICPIDRGAFSCSDITPRPVLEVKRRFFRHRQWRRLKYLTFGTKLCTFKFMERHILRHLPELRILEMQVANISMNFGRLSEIMCCPLKLSNLYLKDVEIGSDSTQLSKYSFTGFHALIKAIIHSSPKLLNAIEFIFNTSSTSFQFEIYGNLPLTNRNFSSLALTNDASESTLILGLHDNKNHFLLDASPAMSGFSLSVLALTNQKLIWIGDSPLGSFSLKTLLVTQSGLDQRLLSSLLKAVRQVRKPALFRALSVQFQQRKPGFPYDDFNALCKALPYLKEIEISNSLISFSDSKQLFGCPQLYILSINNCNLRDMDLPAKAFSGLPKLKKLRLIHNRLNTFPKDTLRQTPKLEMLSLANNYRMEFRANSLRGILPNLAYLDISATGIGEQLTDAFIDQRNLTELFLDSLHKLETIRCPFEGTWFRGCSRLQRLSLSQNVFFSQSACQANGFFEPLANLQELNIESCGFGKQTNGVLKTLLTNLTSLVRLMMSGNAIAKLEFFLSVKMPNLTTLLLSNNQFSGFQRNLININTPNLRKLLLSSTPIVTIDPATFERMPDLRVQLGNNQFACTCDLMPFTDWMRQQWPQYQIEGRGEWLSDAHCHTMPNGSRAKQPVKLLDFRLSWWSCYSRRLIVFLCGTIAALLLIFIVICLLVKLRWKLQYSALAFCIRHGIVKRRRQSEWAYDACFIYDETDSAVSEWVEALILKLETDLRLRLYEAERDAPVGSNILDEAASAIDKSRHAVLVLSRGFLENRLSMYSAQWSNESLFMRRRSLAILVMRERLSESDLRLPGCKVLHRLYRMCKPSRIVDCSGCGVGGNSANRLGLMLYGGASRARERRLEDSETPKSAVAAETEPLLSSS